MDWVVAFLPLTVGLVLLTLIGLLAGRAQCRGWPWLLIPFVLTCLLGSPYMLIATLVLAAVLVIHRWELISARAYKASVLSIAITTLGVCIGLHASKVVWLQSLRAEYPLVSVSRRLAQTSGTAAAVQRSTGAVTVSQIRDNLEHFEDSRQYRNDDQWMIDYRDRSLNALHARTFDAFVAAQGFGVSRGVRAQPEWVRLAPAALISQECARPEPPTDVPAVPPKLPTLERLHWSSAGDFVQAGRLGYVQDRDHVAGFEPHAFTAAPNLKAPDDRLWRVSEVALVSLLLHQNPCVYETEHLPNLQELAGAHVPTRSLDKFEAAALDALWRERDIVVDDAASSNQVRMLGSLRALQSCVQCHDVPVGTLLGAFTYRLLPHSVAITLRP